MDIFQVLIIGGAVAFNVLIIKHKLEKFRYADAALDTAVLFVLAILFAGSLGGLQVATVASAIVSIYLWYNPPRQFFKLKINPKNKFKL